MTDDQSLQRLTPDELLGDPAGTEPTGPVEKRARDMATGVALVGLGLVAAGLMAILALVLNQLLIFAILAAGVLGGLYFSFHYVVWGRRLNRQLAGTDDEPDRHPAEPSSQAQETIDRPDAESE